MFGAVVVLQTRELSSIGELVILSHRVLHGGYTKTKEEYEQALAEMIAEKKAEIAAEKAKMA